MGGGLKALALLEKARHARLMAKHLRGLASSYSPKDEFVREIYETANQADLDAYYYKRRAQDKD